jgi:hypothetical protein
MEAKMLNHRARTLPARITAGAGTIKKCTLRCFTVSNAFPSFFLSEPSDSKHSRPRWDDCLRNFPMLSDGIVFQFIQFFFQIKKNCLKSLFEDVSARRKGCPSRLGFGFSFPFGRSVFLIFNWQAVREIHSPFFRIKCARSRFF